MHLRYATVAAAMIAATAGSANAAVVISASTPGKVFKIDYDGKVKGSTTTLLGALGTFTFTGTSPNQKTYNFSYSLTNTSTNSSRLRSFGFDVTSALNASSISATGAFAFTGMNQNYPEAIGKIEVCFKPTNNGTCTGGQGGLTSGLTGTGTFSLTFSAAQQSIALDNFVTRFQSISPSINGGDSGVGIGSLVIDPPPAVPEPATWAFMILGTGLAGGALRRSRRIAARGTAGVAVPAL